jgi:hypothetical protein
VTVPAHVIKREGETSIVVREANEGDIRYAITITDEMEASAKARGTGIAKRSPDYVAHKMKVGKAVIALTEDGTWVGFCYIEAWGQKKFVANSGLIVSPPFRKTGVATYIKRRIFNLSRSRYPDAKIFGLTTGLAVMKMNSELGYVPVTYSELTDDEEFWSGCKSCVNFDILMSKDKKNCLCTAMLYKPSAVKGADAIQASAGQAEQPRTPAEILDFKKAANPPKDAAKSLVNVLANRVIDRLPDPIKDRISKIIPHKK